MTPDLGPLPEPAPIGDSGYTFRYTAEQMHAERARAYAAGRADAPRDWKLVPLAPTHAMLEKACTDTTYTALRRYWAAMLSTAPKYAAAPPAQAGAEPVAWLRAIDEALVTHHVGVADSSDDYETAKRKLNTLLCHAQSIGEYFAKQDAAPPASPVVEALRAVMNYPGIREYVGRQIAGKADAALAAAEGER